MDIKLETQDEILALFGKVLDRVKIFSYQELAEVHHLTGEMRNNPQLPWSLRTAAEMIHTAAKLRMQEHDKPV